MKISSKWILQAVNMIKDGLARKLENNGVIVYMCGDVIRIDIKKNAEVEE